MLIVRPVGPSAAAYYFRGEGAGVWLGSGCPALGLHGSVARVDLDRVLTGCHPADGRYLPSRRPARRRSGWDLIFAAPKSLSLVGAALPGQSAAVSASHREAVRDVLREVEARHIGASRGCVRVPVTGAVSAAFEHSANAAGEPHLHTHVLLLNLGQQPTGEWSALSSSDWWPWRRALGALYQLGLRHHLARSGLELDWRIRPDGLGDLAAVPRASVRAASARSRLAASVGWPESRRSPSASSVRAESLDPMLARREPASRQAGLDAPGLADDVATTLGLERSAFRPADVILALSARCPGGARAADAYEWAERFAGRSEPAAGAASPRWTTATSKAADERLVAMALEYPGVIEVLGAPRGRSNLRAHTAAVAARLAAEEQRDRSAGVAAEAAAALRWQALTGLQGARLGAAVDVLVVDGADRRSTPQLLATLSSTQGRAAHLLLVEGGSRPTLTEPRSAGFIELGDRIGRVEAAPAPDWSRPGPDGGAGHHAAHRLVMEWVERLGARPSPVLVGLGIDEVLGLNSAARAVLQREGELDGPELTARGRSFRAGDRVVVLSGRGSSRRRGEAGRVLDVDAGRQAAVVRWDAGGRAERLDPSAMARLGHGYAAVPALAARTQGPLLLLGNPHDVPAIRSRVVAHRRCLPEVGRSRALDRADARGIEL